MSAFIRNLLWSTFFTALVFTAAGCVKSHDMAPELIIVDDESPQGDSASPSLTYKIDSKPVRLEVFAMSKCPFFPDAFFEMVPVVERLADYVDFDVHYVGDLDDRGEITSMHGPDEVEGNMQQLCAHSLGSRRQWLDFLKCQLEDVGSVPQNWRECAKSAKIDTLKMQACYKGASGKKLLADSVAVSRKNSINASPSIMLDGAEYMKPRRELSIGRAVCGKLADKTVASCSEYPPAAPVTATLILDKRCRERDCDKTYLRAFLNNMFDSVEVIELDYSEPKAAALFKRSGFRFVPVAIFSQSIKDDEYAYGKLRDYLTEIDKGSLAYPIGRLFDPSVEICDDGVDNTGNGMADCEDPFCQGHWLCREEMKNRVDLYIMSHCPYCTIALKAMSQVLASVGNDRNVIDFHVGFVGEISADELYSAHGEEEVVEDLRQICAEKHYFKDYKFLDYFLCRNNTFMKTRGDDEPENSWRGCARGGIDAAVIERCATGPEGKRLLLEAFKRAKDLEIGGTPTWMLNNRYEMDARSAEEIVNEFCYRNEENPACVRE